MQCGKDYYAPPPVLKYAFKEPVSVYPYQTNYKTGDTIWLSLDLLDKKLFDTISHTSVLFDSASFNASAEVELEYNYPYNYNGPFVSFQFPDSSDGKVYEGYGPSLSYVIGNLNYGSEVSAGYHFKLGMVLLKKGVFLIRFNNNQVTRSCSCNDYILMNYVFDVNDTHADFYRQVPFKNIGESPNPAVIQLLESKTGIVIQVD